jgi:pimeloyl-ACP methyl ester carboxylesterase
MPSVLLIHGGLWADNGADWFWRRTGVVDGLAGRGFTVIAPDRLRRATSWAAEASHIASLPDLADGPVTVVGGSFGSTVAVRLALDFPGLVGRLVLAWPTSTADQFARTRFRADLARQGAPAAVLDALLGTETLPGATDAELRTLAPPAGVVPSAPPTNALHPRSAVDALLRLLPSAVELPSYPEAPRPEFAPHLESFVAALADFARE